MASATPIAASTQDPRGQRDQQPVRGEARASANLATVPHDAMTVHDIIGERLDHPMMARLEAAAERGPQLVECPECDGQGWIGKSVPRCCGGSDWECGASGCTGPIEECEQEQCEYCRGSGHYETNPKLALERLRSSWTVVVKHDGISGSLEA